MSEAFKVGEHVGWNSEAGQVSGRIVRIHTQDFDWKGYTHHASAADPHNSKASVVNILRSMAKPNCSKNSLLTALQLITASGAITSLSRDVAVAASGFCR